MVFPGSMPVAQLLMMAFCLACRRGRSPNPRGSRPGPQAEAALEILRKRCPRGEITKKQFEELTRDLTA
jgi:uncharacterized membrane protein